MFNLQHVIISISNVDRSTEFYKKFGFEDFKYYQDDNIEIKTLKKDSMVIEMLCNKEYNELPNYCKDLDTHLKTLGTKYFGFCVENINEAKEYVLYNGLATNVEIHKGRLGKDYFIITDPDGILVEIIERD